MLTDQQNLFILSKGFPGYKIIESPVNLTLTDQDNHLLSLRNEKLTIRFHVREAI